MRVANREVISRYFDLGGALYKRYKEYKKDNSKEASNALVFDYVKNQISEVSDGALRKRMERARKIYKLFTTDEKLAKQKIALIKSFSLRSISNLKCLRDAKNFNRIAVFGINLRLVSFSRKKKLFIFIFLTLHFIFISFRNQLQSLYPPHFRYIPPLLSSTSIFAFIVLGILGILLALLGFFCTGDLFYAFCRSKYNNNLFIKTIDKGNRPGTGVKFFPRNEIVERLKRILQPDENQSYYYLICGEHGTGKTTLFRTASSNVDLGVVYVDVPARVEDLGKLLILRLKSESLLQIN
ncbi:hypothetical protein Glove_174g105 [Diversispora epigaea]|uniref:Uncharacterized protein n=1 Tax=Diversispora epigaea TaxID=1348612 RepID=A0A397ISA3_9GLOM|nr:hypothetical protein Glove_174g105 [Diversispora epigaea]